MAPAPLAARTRPPGRGGGGALQTNTLCKTIRKGAWFDTSIDKVGGRTELVKQNLFAEAAIALLQARRD